MMTNDHDDDDHDDKGDGDDEYQQKTVKPGSNRNDRGRLYCNDDSFAKVLPAAERNIRKTLFAQKLRHRESINMTLLAQKET